MTELTLDELRRIKNLLESEVDMNDRFGHPVQKVINLYDKIVTMLIEAQKEQA